MISRKKLLLLFLMIRTFMALISISWYVPDETWQSVEVAHGIVWSGKAFKTWEWDHGLRSYLHPLLFVPVFQLLKFLQIDSRFLVSLAPRLLQGLLSSFADVCFVTFFDRHFSKRPADTKWFIFIYSTNWCLLYSGSRTLVNQLELVLTGFALSMFNEMRTGYIAIVVLSFIIRPTTAIFWLPLVLSHLLTIWHSGESFIKRVILELAPPAFAMLTICIMIDSVFYTKLTLVPWNFLRFNLLLDVSSQYGVNSFHWYLTNALPTIFLGPLGLVPLICGLLKSIKETKNIFLVSLIWSIFVYSCLAHKEHRFILPLVPLCICYTSSYISSVNNKKKFFQRLFIFATLASHLPLTVYLSLVHQTGTTKIVQHLAGKFDHNSSPGRILFLMPCHSTPFYSHFHLTNANLRFLECPPRLSKSEKELLDEADLFFQNPRKNFKLIFDEFAPTHIVTFDSMSETLKDDLKWKSFRICDDLFHSHIPEGRVGSRVHVHCKTIA